MTQKHSKLPWKQHTKHPSIIVIEENEPYIGDIYDDEEDTPFVIKAVNHHYELLEALKNLLTALDKEGDDPDFGMSPITWDKYKEALQLLQSLDSHLGKHVESSNEVDGKVEG